jgi:hypothetical protein
MRKRVNVLLAACAVVALQPPFPIASRAADGGSPARQEGEGRWVPSLAITGGTTIQGQDGSVDSVLFEGTNPMPVRLQGFHNGGDLAVAPFVGGNLELMSPALPIPTRPRFFLTGEILPSFSANREVALDGDPTCVKGPEPNAPCARDIVVVDSNNFEETAANGEGSSTSAQVGTLVFGAGLGVSFPGRIGKRQLRIKPSAGWISYEVDAEGLVVDAACDPTSTCISPGFLRETVLEGSASQRFHAVGGGLDIEMDTGRFGPIGASLFLGARFYRVLGDRTISFEASEAFDDQIGEDLAVGSWEVEVNPWMYRAHVGIRFQWLGSPN